MISLAESEVQIETLFIGREEELDTLAKFTDVPGSVSVVTGIGGIGKTALLRLFEQRIVSNFPGGVFHITSHIGGKNILEKLAPIDSSSGHALVVVDDVEALQATEVEKIHHFLTSKGKISLVLSGRLVPIDRISNINVLALKGLNATEMFEARAKYLEPSPELDKAMDIIQGNPLLFQLILKAPREILLSINNLYGNKETQSFSVESKKNDDLCVDIQDQRDVNADFVGLIFAFLLFILSYANSQETEERLTNELHKLEVAVAEQTELITDNVSNPHYATEFVNLRKEPILLRENIHTVLGPNQVVSLLSVNDEWARVEFMDSISSKKTIGWVHTKYLSPVK